MARGSIRQHGQGYEARITINGIGYSKSFPTMMEARAYLDTLIDQHKRKPRREHTLGTWGESWLRERRRSKVTRHSSSEESLWKVQVAEWPIADIPLRRLQRKHIVAHIKANAESGRWSRQSVAHGLGIIKRALMAAHDSGLIQSNPADGVRVPRMARSSEDPWTWMTQPEIDAVVALEHAKSLDAERRAFFSTAIYTGLRLSELLHLRWERVILDGERPRIEVRAPLKSREARRDVPLLPQAVAALRAYRGPQKRIGLVWHGAGGRMRHEQWDGAWRDKPYKQRGKKKVRLGAKTRAGIKRRVRFHDLRHTCASHLVQGTWMRPLTLHEVKDWMGHSSISVTERYAHLAPDGIHDAARDAKPAKRKRGE